jgi:hypothetical protein
VLALAGVALMPSQIAMATGSPRAEGWSGPYETGTSSAIVSLSCASDHFCAGINYQGRIMIGLSPTSPSIYTVGPDIQRVSCTSDDSCRVTWWDSNGGYVSVVDSSGVQSATLMNPGYKIHGVSCPNTGFCIVGAATRIFRYSASVWQDMGYVDLQDTGGAGIESVSCPSVSFCAAVDQLGNVLTYGAGRWSAPLHVDSSALHAISCTASRLCIAVDARQRILIYKQGAWSAAHLIGGRNPVADVSCAGISFCMAVTPSGYSFEFNGSAWARPDVVDPNVGFSSVSCSSPAYCVAADQAGRYFVKN